jgi:hypothetical protein
MCDVCGCGDPNLVPVEVHARLLERNDHDVVEVLPVVRPTTLGTRTHRAASAVTMGPMHRPMAVRRSPRTVRPATYPWR